MATSGHFCWPPMGNSYWPLTRSGGEPQRRCSTSNYSCSNKPVLQRPVELAQFTSVSFAETLALESIAASIGSIGDAYDNALAESTIGPFKPEAIRDDSPFRNGPLKQLEDVEWVTAE